MATMYEEYTQGKKTLEDLKVHLRELHEQFEAADSILDHTLVELASLRKVLAVARQVASDPLARAVADHDVLMRHTK